MCCQSCARSTTFFPAVGPCRRKQAQRHARTRTQLDFLSLVTLAAFRRLRAVFTSTPPHAAPLPSQNELLHFYRLSPPPSRCWSFSLAFHLRHKVTKVARALLAQSTCCSHFQVNDVRSATDRQDKRRRFTLSDLDQKSLKSPVLLIWMEPCPVKEKQVRPNRCFGLLNANHTGHFFGPPKTTRGKAKPVS